MEDNKESTPVCRSIFKNGESTTTVQAFTDKWIQLINALEKGK